MPTPSSYLVDVQNRLHDRRTLAQRDVEAMLEALRVKTNLLQELRNQVARHRLEDREQLVGARRETWSSWEERLKRLEDWMKSAAATAQGSATVRAWQAGAKGLNRAQELARQFAKGLDRLAIKLDNQLASTAEDLSRWGDRLRGTEAEVRAFLDRQESKSTEIMVSKARKQPFIDFLYVEREEEGRLSLRLKGIRSAANQALARMEKASQWVAKASADTKGQFAGSTAGIAGVWGPFEARFSRLRETALNEALIFEESRQRLRWIYEQVQRMRIVQETATQRKPLIERLFGSND